jgi:hypothetical protein
MSKPRKAPQPRESIGSVLGGQLRKRTNALTKTQRAALRRRGMQLINARPIYAVTACTRDARVTRAFGWFPDARAARKAVRENQGSMQECLYEWLVIEIVPPGVHAEAKAIHWYRWRKGRWTACPAPKWSLGLVNFSVG